MCVTGNITGFPQPHIRSTWPSAIRGKLLTDKRIEHYRKLGFYGANGIIALQKKQTFTKVEKKKKVNKLKQLMEKYR